MLDLLFYALADLQKGARTTADWYPEDRDIPRECSKVISLAHITCVKYAKESVCCVEPSS